MVRLRLIKQLVEQKLKRYIDAELNKKVDVWNFYQAYTLSLVAMEENIENKDSLNKIWKIYVQKSEKRLEIDFALNKSISNNDFYFVNRFLREAEKVIPVQVPETNFNHRGVIGIVASYFNEFEFQ